MALNFFEEDISFNLKEKIRHKHWLKALAQNEGYKITDLNYIFCSDEYLHQMNIEYLNHDTYTDIITFDNSESKNIIEGDIFISIPRVKENANSQNIDFNVELKRVLAHGLLHLMGYKDKTELEIKTMRAKEDNSILIYQDQK